MRRDSLYLQDMLEACDAIEGFLTGMDLTHFRSSELHRSATLQKPSVIGEAASRLSAAFRAANPQVEWRDLAAFRDIAVHAYFSVDWAIVWDTAVFEVPELRSRRREMAGQEGQV